MDFPDLPSSQERSPIFDHLVIIAVRALTLVAFQLSYVPNRGKGSASDAIGFSLLFVAVGYYFGWLPSLWEMSRRRGVGSLVMPTFIVLVLAYFYLTFRTYHIQPGATVFAFIAQLIALIYLSSRT